MNNRDLLVQRVVESLLDGERLRSRLTDIEARVLLAWGQAQAARIVKEAAAGEDAEKAQVNIDDGTRRLRRVLREINDLTGEKDGLSAADIRQRLTQLLQEAGADATQAKEDIEQVTVLRSTASGEEFMVQLTELLSRHWPAGQVKDGDGGFSGLTSIRSSCMMLSKFSAVSRSTRLIVLDQRHLAASSLQGWRSRWPRTLSKRHARCTMPGWSFLLFSLRPR
ncbi:MAG: hypothetical protein HYY30_02780 [Chloroflexi bacterium]|nr:hypothetical protein [Chloroflexota bacterium]